MTDQVTTQETEPKKKKLNAFSYDANDLVIIGYDTEDGREHPLYDERIHMELSEALVRNIMAYGVIEPIVCRKEGERFVVVAGRQRVRAAREANNRLEQAGEELLSVPVILRRGGDAGMLGIMISENEIRKEDEISSKLMKLEKLFALGKTEEECAIIFGVTRQTIKNMISLMESGEAVKEAVEKGELTATAGMQIAKLPRDEQAEAIEEVKAVKKNSNGKRKATTQVAQQVVKARKKNTENGTDEATIVPPTKRVLRKLIETGEIQRIEAEPYQIVEWILGDLSPARIKGLTAAIRSLEKPADE